MIEILLQLLVFIYHYNNVIAVGDRYHKLSMRYINVLYMRRYFPPCPSYINDTVARDVSTYLSAVTVSLVRQLQSKYSESEILIEVVVIIAV
jgi:hypothetical protein